MDSDIDTSLGIGYVATLTQAGTVEAVMPDGSSMLLAKRDDAGQVTFIAISNKVRVSDAGAIIIPFKGAFLSVEGGGGASVTFDDVPTAGSENAVTSNGVYVACLHHGSATNSVQLGGTALSSASTAIGKLSFAQNTGSVAVGSNSSASGVYSSVLGQGSAVTAWGTSALGNHAEARGVCSTVLGTGARAGDAGIVVLCSNEGISTYDWTRSNIKTSQLYFIAAGSPLSELYCGGEAGLGYIEHTGGMGITRRGTKKLSELLTDHATDFTPTLNL